MKPTTTATLLLIGVFLGGLLGGVLTERTLLGPTLEAHAASPPTTPHDGERHDRSSLVLQLDLTAEQQAEVDAILTEQQRRIRAILRETRPQTRAVLKETREQIEEVLTPEQRDRLRALHLEARQRDRTQRDN